MASPCLPSLPVPHDAAGSSVLSILFVLGVQKGGTNFLHNALRGHPDIVPPSQTFRHERVAGRRGIKETHYFDTWPLPAAPDDRLAEYLALFSCNATTPTATLLDSTPSYLYTSAAPDRILLAFPAAKFVVIWRDPLARAWSHYNMDVRACQAKGRHCPASFEAEVRQEIASMRAAGCHFDQEPAPAWRECFQNNFIWPQGCERQAWPSDSPCKPLVATSGYVRNGLYAPQLLHWLDSFPRHRFLVIKQAQLQSASAADQLTTVNSVLEHAGLAPYPVASNLTGISGYHGAYGHTSRSASDRAAFETLRRYYRLSELEMLRFFA